MKHVRCLECGKPGDYYYDGVCHECASRPFGILWQLEQPRQPTREEVERERLEAKCLECGKPGDYYDGVCYECAAQPFGLLWQIEQDER